MPIVAQGGTIKLEALFRTGTGVPADGTSIQFQLRDPDGNVAVGPHGVPPVVDEPGIGVYSYTWAVSPTADLGDWVAEWSGIVFGEQVAGTEQVEVVLPGSVDSGLYTYDLSTLVGQVRLYIDDRDLSRITSSIPLEQRSAIFMDQEIEIFLTAANNVVLYAAALGLQTIANNRQLIVQARRLGKTSVDYGSVRRDYMAQAEALRKLAAEQGFGPMAPVAQYAEIAYTDFALRQVILNTDLRVGTGPPTL